MKRSVKILKYLLQTEGFTTIYDLSELYKVSTRSIRDDLNIVEDYLSGTNAVFIRDRHQGVFIDKSHAGKQELAELLKKIDSEDNYLAEEERFWTIIKELLLADGFVTYDFLITKTKTSKTTAIKDLAECEKWLRKRKILVVRKTGIGIGIDCRESAWRGAALEYIEKYSAHTDFTNLSQSFHKKDFLLFDFSADSFINYFSRNVNLHVVNNFIKKYEREQQVKFSEDSFIKIFFYLLIAVRRAKGGRTLKADDLTGYDFADLYDIEEWVHDNSKFLRMAADVRLDETEMKFLLFYMLSQSKQYAKNSVISILFDEDELAEHFMQTVQDILCVNLIWDQDLFCNLKMHISSTVHRLMFGIEVKNPLKDEIKEKYPEIFKACEMAGKLFKEKLGRHPGEDETGFLTMHIAAFLEKTKNDQMTLKFVRAVIVCSSGVGTSNMLHMRLLNEFPDLVIEKVCSVEEFDRLNKKGIHLVISTTPLSIGLKESVIYVSPLLNEQDIIRIRKFIGTFYVKGQSDDSFVVEDLMDIISKNCIIRDYHALETQIKGYFMRENQVCEDDQPLLSELAIEEHILLNKDAADWEAAVRLGGELMYGTGSVEKGYIQRMVEARKELGANIVIAKGIALPHAKSGDGVKKTCMAFLTLKEPVCFGNPLYDPVNFVVLLGAAEDKGHRKALAELVELLEDEETLKRLRHCQSKAEFRHQLETFERRNRKELNI